MRYFFSSLIPSPGSGLSIVGAPFILFLSIVLICYYVVPDRIRWVIMFLSSLAFIIFVGDFGVLPYFLISIGVSWLGALLIERKANTQKQKDLLLFITIAILIIELTLKYAEFFIQPFIALTNHFGMSVCLDGISVIVPVGMAYFQLTLIGYVTDVYRSTCKAQLNILKHTLFTSWFPVLTCGPILRKSEMDDELFGVHHFNYQQLCFGLQRMIWGYFKKLIVADRLAIFVASVYSDVSQVAGVFIAIAAILFLLQLYCDFSGCIDIVLGVSQCFGVRLPENFRTPFFSKSIEEWWRRWHITLGAWSKDYLLYPLLKSSVFQTIGRFSKKILGKKIGKKVPLCLASIILWTILGIWHGGSYKWLVAAGLMPIFWFVLSEFFGDSVKKVGKALRINTECFSFNLFRMLRNLVMISITLLIAPALGFRNGLSAWNQLFTNFNIEALTRSNIMLFGLDVYDFYVVVIGLLIIWSVDFLHEKGYSLRETLAVQNLVFRWAIYLIAILSVIIFGAYGAGYDASAFIYKW